MFRLRRLGVIFPIQPVQAWALAFWYVLGVGVLSLGRDGLPSCKDPSRNQRDVCSCCDKCGPNSGLQASGLASIRESTALSGRNPLAHAGGWLAHCSGQCGAPDWLQGERRGAERGALCGGWGVALAAPSAAVSQQQRAESRPARGAQLKGKYVHFGRRDAPLCGEPVARIRVGLSREWCSDQRGVRQCSPFTRRRALSGRTLAHPT